MTREPKDGDMEPAGSGEEFGPWYDMQTGQQFARLPMQPISFQKYVRKGWIPGIAPIELQAKWEAGQVDRDKANQDAARKLIRTRDGQKLVKEADKSATEASADDVAGKVIDKLIKLGIIKVPDEIEISNQETGAAADLEEAGSQLKLL